MRNLGILILLSAAAFAQTSTAAQNSTAPAAVSVQSTTAQTAQAGKPSPNGAKASPTNAGPRVKAVSVKAPAAKSGTLAPKPKPVSVQVAAKPALSAPKVKTVSAQTTGKPVIVDPKGKTGSVQASAGKPATSGLKAVPAVKSVPVAATSAKPALVPVTTAASQPHAVSVKTGSAGAKPAVAHVMTKPATVKAVGTKVARAHAGTSHAKVAVATAAGPKATPSVQDGKSAPENKPASEEIHTTGRRDPFISPVVAMGATGSGCSAGKRCLTIDQIALKGVVKSEAGMIAVVTNAVDKAYFLRENDPVFNGYVVKITGDSIIFKETFHDRLGKTLTRDVTKSITRPVA